MVKHNFPGALSQSQGYGKTVPYWTRKCISQYTKTSPDMQEHMVMNLHGSTQVITQYAKNL